MKGWHGNRYGHSLASRGIKSKRENIVDTMKVPPFVAKMGDGKTNNVRFKISDDDETNDIKGGHLIVVIGYGYYYVDTLMEDTKEYLNGQRLQTHGGMGDSGVVTNMDEFIEYILDNRHDIQRRIRGWKLDEEPLDYWESDY